MRRKYIATALGLIFAVCAPAGAQTVGPVGPLIANLGDCIAERMPERARTLLAAPVHSREEVRAAQQLGRSNSACIGRRTFLSGHVGELRGVVAQALLRREPSVLDRLSALPARPPVRAESADGRQFVINYARCLVDSGPDKAVRLIGTANGAPEERTAFLALDSALRDCMPLGYSYRVNLFDVRNHIAARLYELAYGEPVAPPSGGTL